MDSRMVNKFLVVLLLLGMSLPALAQVGVRALIKTTLTNAKTGGPLQTKYEIIAAGKLGGAPKITGKSDAEGKFESVYKPGEAYTVYCKPTDGLAAPYVFSVAPSTEYYEIEQTLPIKILKPGDEIGEWTLFGTGKSTLVSEEELAGILVLVRGNRGLSVTINVSGDMEVATKKGKPAKKSKSSKKSKSAPPPPPVTDIRADRMNAITAYCTQQSTPEMLRRITIQQAPPTGKNDVSVLVKDFKYFGMD